MYTIEQISTGVQTGAAARSRIYQILALSFMYPDTDFIDPIKQGEYRKALHSVMQELPYRFSSETEAFLSGSDLEYLTQEDIEAEFIRIFDGGPGGPPVSLNEGQYVPDQMVVMEELVRFYNHFGLSYAEGDGSLGNKELPDHLVTELEFLHYLSFKELLALKENHDPMPYRRSLADFISRHPAKWLPEAMKNLDTISSKFKEKLSESFIAFYRNLLVFTLDFLKTDMEYALSLTEKNQ